MTRGTRWHLVSWRVRDGRFKDVVFVQARLDDDGELETRSPCMLRDSRREEDQTSPLPWLNRMTRFESAFVERMVLELEAREELYPLSDLCLQCGRTFSRCNCDEITNDLSVA